MAGSLTPPCLFQICFSQMSKWFISWALGSPGELSAVWGLPVPALGASSALASSETACGSGVEIPLVSHLWLQWSLGNWVQNFPLWLKYSASLWLAVLGQ